MTSNVVEFRPAEIHGRASTKAGRPSILISCSSEMSGKAVKISGHASRGNWLRCFQALTAPGRRPTSAANTAGPPLSSMIEAGVGSLMHHALPSVTSSSKPQITPGNVTVGNVIRMRENDDGSWKNLTEGWQRVRWARERWQRRTQGEIGKASEAAESLDMKAGTYRAYERPPDASKSSALTVDMAKSFARLFGVDLYWLLTGEGAPFKAEPDAKVALAVRAFEAMEPTKQKLIIDMIEALEEPAKPADQHPRYRA